MTQLQLRDTNPYQPPGPPLWATCRKLEINTTPTLVLVVTTLPGLWHIDRILIGDDKVRPLLCPTIFIFSCTSTIRAN
jgi:hypothetical protein